jgi:perosamine synthetase
MARKMQFRQLPPSAVPVELADLRAGLFASSTANEALREAVADYCGLAREACYLASSGRTVLYTLLKGLAAERPSRTQVVMPAYTCPVLPRVALDLGLKPVYVDIWPESTRYMQDQLEASVGQHTLAVFLVHPFGIPIPIDEVLRTAHNAGAVLVEDAAQAMGAYWAGQPVGIQGDYGLFSLGPGKPLSTGGGGIVVTGRAENIGSLGKWWQDLPPASDLGSAQAWLRQAAFRMAFHPHGWWAATRLGLQHLGNQEESWGYTVRGLSNAQAGIGLALLPRLDEINRRRRQVAGRLLRAIADAPGLQTLQVEPAAEPFYLRLPVLAESESRREQLHNQMWAAGIGAGRMYEKTLPAIFDPQNRDAFPGAEAFASRLLTLPTHYHVSENDLQVMGEILNG